MEKFLRLLGVFALAFLALAANADELVPVPPLAARVTDLTGTLRAGERASLEAELRTFEQTKGSQIAVLLLPTTQPETIEQYSIRVAERWKIGRAKTDDGVILIIAKNDYRLRIEVGYGLEGAIPDVVAKRVIREVIAPHLLANDFYGGIRDGTQTLMKLIEGEKLPPPARSAQAPGVDDYQSLFVVLLVVIVVAGGILKAMLGRVLGSAATGVAAGFIAWALAGAVIAALIAGVVAFFIALLGGGRGVFPGGMGGGFGSGGVGGGCGGGGCDAGAGGGSGSGATGRCGER